MARASATAAAAPPSLATWASRWAAHGDAADQARELHAVVLGFLTGLADAGRSRETVAAHTANLWLLGAEIMAFFRASPANRARGVAWYFATCMTDGDGPVPKLLRRKDEIRAYQATCRQLVRHLRARAVMTRT